MNNQTLAVMVYTLMQFHSRHPSFTSVTWALSLCNKARLESTVLRHDLMSFVYFLYNNVHIELQCLKTMIVKSLKAVDTIGNYSK